jgi:non-lysosomal glucosylceramidase
MKAAYSKQTLLQLGPQRTFTTDKLAQISFPLGGIGTGCVGLSGTGGLRDWEIFNRPNVGSRMAKTFPAIWAREKGKDPVCRVLQAPDPPPYIGGGGGDPCQSGEGLPHMDGAVFRGEYPFAWIEFASKKLPVRVNLEAYNPFIPSNADDSGHPAAILKYSVTNPGENVVDCCIAWSLLNMVGTIGEAEKDPVFRTTEFGWGQNVNQYVERDGLKGLYYSSDKWAADHPRFGSMGLFTPNKNVTAMTYWLREPWFTPMHDFWDNFSATGKFPDRDYGPSDDGNTDAGSLGVRLKLQPGQTRTATFYITWYFPNFEKYWHKLEAVVGQIKANQTPPVSEKPVWRNYYANQFSDAADAAAKLHNNEKRLYETTKRFHDALFSTTVPPYVLDAVSSQMAILKTPTCARLEDGTLYGFEGSAPISGCCEGSCTHVWNYQQTLPFLFPSLERSMRSADYQYNLRPDGSMGFRLQLPLGSPPDCFLPCADGQLGGVIKTYRDWKICGDDGWLRRVWPRVQQALEFAWKDWDPNRDGVMTGPQHNTYDIEFHGANLMTGAFYLGALHAAAEMAEYLGEWDDAGTYRTIFEKGRVGYEKLFNGQYYEQHYDEKTAPRYQYGRGCLSDQMIGQWLASMAGLPHLLDPKRIRTTLKNIVRHNWKRQLGEHANAQRVYATHDEPGLVLCTWPMQGRPAVPFVYSDEVWSGVEYQVASHLILEGMLVDGLRLAKAVRERHDGQRRNPWDEFECGHHNARAMSAYGMLIACCGFQYDKGKGIIGFAPRIYPENFRGFWALDGAWGIYGQQEHAAHLTVLYGELMLRELRIPVGPEPSVHADGRLVPARVAGGAVLLDRMHTLDAGETLSVAW